MKPEGSAHVFELARERDVDAEDRLTVLLVAENAGQVAYHIDVWGHIGAQGSLLKQPYSDASSSGAALMSAFELAQLRDC